MMGIVQKLRRSVKSLLPARLREILDTVGAYKKAFGCYPNIFFPKTFNEKIQWRKIFERDARLPKLADKVLVKEFVREKIGSEYLIPTLWHGTSLPPREDRNWPIPFVIKANHGSGWNIFVRNESERNWDAIEKTMDTWLGQVHAPHLGEWLYSEIIPQILVEPFIGDMARLPIDYKLWTFGGKVHYIEVITDRGIAAKQVFYDLNWKRLSFINCYVIETQEILKPSSLNTMIAAAEKVAEGISMVRVDFYEINSRPIFGEMTFYPASGYDAFDPPELDRIIGDLWKLGS
jgi:hypothetical protein